MEHEPTEREETEALEWMLKEKEGKDIKILDPKEEREKRGRAKKKTKKLIADLDQKELFKENT